MSMGDFRTKYPQFNHLSDEDVYEKLHREQGTKASDAEWAEKIAPAQVRNVAEIADPQSLPDRTDMADFKFPGPIKSYDKAGKPSVSTIQAAPDPKGRVPLPRNASRMEKFDRAVHVLADPVVRTSFLGLKAHALGAVDIAWEALNKYLPEGISNDLPLSDAIDEALGYDPGKTMKILGHIAEFSGGYRAGAKILKAINPATVKLSRLGKAAQESLRFGISEVGGQVTKAVSEPERYQGASAVLTAMGIGAAVGVGKEFVVKPLIHKALASAIGQKIAAAGHDLLIKYSKNFPQTMDVLRKTPHQQYRDEVWKVVEGRNPGIQKNMLTPQERAGLNHVAREISRRVTAAHKAYMKNPPADVVHAATKKRVSPQLMAPEKGTIRYYRGGPASNMPPNATAADIVRYERTKLGNTIRVEKGVDLKSIPAKNLQWVARSPEAAAEFGTVSKRDISGGRIIAQDPDGGVLLDIGEPPKPTGKPIVKTIPGTDWQIVEGGEPTPVGRRVSWDEARSIVTQKLGRMPTPDEVEQEIVAIEFGEVDAPELPREVASAPPIPDLRKEIADISKDLGLTKADKNTILDKAVGKTNMHDLNPEELGRVLTDLKSLDILKHGGVAPTSPKDISYTDKPDWMNDEEFSQWRKGKLNSRGVAEASLVRRGFITPDGTPVPGTPIAELATTVGPDKAIITFLNQFSEDLDGLLSGYSTDLFRGKKPFKIPRYLLSLRPTWRIINDTGLSPVLDRPMNAKISYEMDLHSTYNQIATKIKELDKIAETSRADKRTRLIKNIPTPANKQMARAIEYYEEFPGPDAPYGLPQEWEAMFNYWRDLTRDTLLRTNAARIKSGLPAIPTRQAYFRHVLTQDALEMVQGLRPFPAGMEYWSQKMVGRRFRNPMEMHRTIDEVGEDLWKIFSDDLEYVMKSMTRTAFREIYLNVPIKEAEAMLDRLQPSEQQLIDAGVTDPGELQYYQLPKLNRQWAEEYLKVLIRDEQSNADERINELFYNSRAGRMIDGWLHHFGRSLSRRPISEVNAHLVSAVRTGVLGPRPKLLVRNKFQLTQLTGLYPTSKILRAFGPMTDPALKAIMDNSLFLKSYTGLEDAPVGFLNKAEELWHGMYKHTAVSNAYTAYKAGLIAARELVINPKYKEHGWADPQRTGNEAEGFYYDSELAIIEKEAEWGAKATQYQYIGATMPWIYRHKTMRFATQLQSWWMNHFFNFHSEAWSRLRYGTPAWSDGTQTIPLKWRLGYLRYLILGGSILTGLGFPSSYLLGVAPRGLPPIANFMLSAYRYATGAPEHREWRKREMLVSLKTLIPGYILYKDINHAWTTGSWVSLFSYKKTWWPEGPKSERKVRPRRAPTKSTKGKKDRGLF